MGADCSCRSIRPPVRQQNVATLPSPAALPCPRECRRRSSSWSAKRDWSGIPPRPNCSSGRSAGKARCSSMAGCCVPTASGKRRIVMVVRVLLAILLPTLLAVGLWQLVMGRAEAFLLVRAVSGRVSDCLVGWGWMLATSRFRIRHECSASGRRGSPLAGALLAILLRQRRELPDGSASTAAVAPHLRGWLSCSLC